MKFKNFALPILGVLAVSVVGLVSNPVSRSASASGSELYSPVEERYEISGHNLGTEWELVTSLDDLADEQIVTLAAIDDSMGEPVIKVFDCWSMDHDYISSLDDGYIDGNHLYSDSAQGFMFDKINETHGYLSTLENGKNQTIGCYMDEDEFFQMTPTFTNANWAFEFDKDTHVVNIFQAINYKYVYFNYWNGCDMFMVSDDTYFTTAPMYLFKDKFVHQGTRKLSDVDMNGNSLIYNFSAALLNTFDGVCAADGNTDPTALTNAILSIYNSDESDALRAFSKKVFKYAIADENGDTVQKAAALYDYIMLKYTQYQGYEWFGRSEFYPTSSNVTSIASNNVVSIVACSIAVLALLGFVALKFNKKIKA